MLSKYARCGHKSAQHYEYKEAIPHCANGLPQSRRTQQWKRRPFPTSPNKSLYYRGWYIAAAIQFAVKRDCRATSRDILKCDVVAALNH